MTSNYFFSQRESGLVSDIEMIAEVKLASA